MFVVGFVNFVFRSIDINNVVANKKKKNSKKMKN